MAASLDLHCDGAARGNPGPAGVGYLLVGEDGQVVERGGARLGTSTNNQAEYRGLILGLERALALGCRVVRAHSDSQLMVEQVHGRYKVKDAALAGLKAEALARLGKFDAWSLDYRPRTENREADRLANLAIDGRLDSVAPTGAPGKAAAAAPAAAAGSPSEGQRARSRRLAERGPWETFGTATFDEPEDAGDRAGWARQKVREWLAEAERVLGTAVHAAFVVEAAETGRPRAHVVLRGEERLGGEDVVALRRVWPVAIGSLVLERAPSEQEVGAFIAEKMVRAAGEPSSYP